MYQALPRQPGPLSSLLYVVAKKEITISWQERLIYKQESRFCREERLVCREERPVYREERPVSCYKARHPNRKRLFLNKEVLFREKKLQFLLSLLLFADKKLFFLLFNQISKQETAILK